MIEVISSWAKSLGIVIVLVSIIEMILPNNRTKKYIRIILGIFVIFNIVSPFIKNKDDLALASIDIENYVSSNSISKNKDNLNQTSMDQRIETLYQEELEKDIIKNIEEQGYEVGRCNVEAKLPNNDNDEESNTGIMKIEIKIDGKIEGESKEQENNIENKIATEVQRIKEVNILENEEKKYEDKENSKVTKNDIQNIKKFLIEEYEVSEECLEIN